MRKKVICAIPARLDSKRFPNKVLAKLGQKTLIEWVFQAASSCSLFDEVFFAIDSLVVAEHLEQIGAPYEMTSVLCTSGTERIIECAKKRNSKGEIWVNWQADEPFINEKMISSLLSNTSDGSDVWTLKKAFKSTDNVHDPNIVKVITDHLGHAIYFSRAAIPYCRDDQPFLYYKHVGLYAYTSEALSQLSKLSVSPLEKMESLEQLTFLYHGLKIKIYETMHEAHGIDTHEDLDYAKKLMASK